MTGRTPFKALALSFCAGAVFATLGVLLTPLGEWLEDQPDKTLAATAEGPIDDSNTFAAAPQAPSDEASVSSQSSATASITNQQEPPRIEYFIPPEVDQSVKDALADGIVTREEYDQAVSNTMACLDAKAVQHSDPVYNDAKIQYEYTVTSTHAPEGVSVYDDCWMRYERDVQSAWVRASQSLKEGARQP